MGVTLNNKDYLWSYIGVFFSVCSNIVMVPFILFYLSSDMYGLWGVFQSVAAITVLFDFGFSTTFARNINYCWNGAVELKRTGVVFSKEKEPNYFLMKKAMLACRMVFFAVSGVAFLIMATGGTLYIHYITNEIWGVEVITAWICYVLAIFLNLYYGYFNSFLRGVGAITAVNRATVVAKGLQIVITVMLLMFGFGIVGTGAAYLSYGIIFRLICKKSFFSFKNIGTNLNKIKEKPGKNEIWEMFQIVWHNAFKEGVVTLANYLANQACTIICSLFMTLSVTGIYSLSVQLATAIVNVSGTLYTANQPVLQSAYISNDKEKTKRTMSLIVVSFSVMYIFGLTACIFVGLPLLRIIKPESMVPVSIMLGVGIYQFVLKFRNCYTSYFSCTNRIPYVNAFLFSALLCVAISFINLKYFSLDIWGLIIAQLVSQGIFNAWYWTIKAHKEMELGAKETCILGILEINKILNGIFKKKKRYKHERK